MFKTEEQVKTFINKLGSFVEAMVIDINSPHVGDSLVLSKRMGELEEFIKTVCNITVASDTTDDYKCPDCGSDMRLRTNRTNGDKFWGCTKYPNCRGTRDSSGLSKAEREEQKYRTEQQDGFSFNRDKRSAATEVSPPVDTGWVNPFAKR